MLKPEKIVVGAAGLLFVLAAALEGIHRLADRPAFHDAAAWVAIAGAFAVLTPIAVAAAIAAFRGFAARRKDRDSDAV